MVLERPVVPGDVSAKATVLVRSGDAKDVNQDLLLSKMVCTVLLWVVAALCRFPQLDLMEPLQRNDCKPAAWELNSALQPL